MKSNAVLCKVQLLHGLKPWLLHYSDWIAKVKKQLQNYSDLSRLSVVKSVNMSFLNIMHVIIFLYKQSCKAWLKITLPENKLKQKL